MARIRTIKPEFFKNEELSELPAMVRLLFIGLWNHADREGRLLDRPKRLKADIFPYDSLDVDKELTRLQKAGFISRYEVGDLKVIQVNTFKKHQRITGSEATTESELPAPPEVLIINDVEVGNTDETLGNTLETPRTTGKEGNGMEGNDISAGDSKESQTKKTEDDLMFDKFQEWVSRNAPRVNQMAQPLTLDELLKLKKDYDRDFIFSMLVKMHNNKPLLKNNVSTYLTFLNWAKRE